MWVRFNQVSRGRHCFLSACRVFEILQRDDHRRCEQCPVDQVGVAQGFLDGQDRGVGNAVAFEDADGFVRWKVCFIRQKVTEK